MQSFSCSLPLLFVLASAATCAAQTPAVEWVRQFGTSDFDLGRRIATAPDGAYISGTTHGAFPGFQSAEGTDGFLQKYDVRGNAVWTRQFGSAWDEDAYALAADANGAYVAGWSTLVLPGQSGPSPSDGFIRKYDPSGKLAWARQFGTPVRIHSLAVDATGIYVAGSVDYALPGQVYGGGNRSDAFVRKYDFNGNVLWTRQFGTPFYDYASNISADSSGVYVSGQTQGAIAAPPPGGGYDVFVRKYDANGNVEWTRQIDSFPAADDFVHGTGVDASGVYVCGETYGVFPNHAKSGSSDAWIRKYDLNGAVLWTRQFGGQYGDSCYGVSPAFDWIYLPVNSDEDKAIWRLNQRDGSISGVLELNTEENAFLVSSATDATGAYVVGLGSLGQMPAGSSDNFLVKVAHPPLPPTITSIGNAFGGAALISPNTWVAIKGVNLATGTRVWDDADFVGGLMPVELDGTQVTVNGKPAYIYSISPAQINILVPPDLLPEEVEVQVTTDGVATDPFTVAAASRSPSFFEFVSAEGRRYVSGRHNRDGTLIGPATLFPGLTTPAQSGESIYIAATGLGGTNMPIVSGAVTQSGVLPFLPVVKVNGVDAAVQFAGLVGAGTFQINLILPPNLPNGDVPITATYAGDEIQPDLYITIQN